MQEIILDFGKCKRSKSTDELYYVIKEKIPYAFDYGNNPNALWDILLYYWEDSEKVNIKLYGTSCLEYRYLQTEMKYILNVLERVHSYTPNVTFEIFS